MTEVTRIDNRQSLYPTDILVALVHILGTSFATAVKTWSHEDFIFHRFRCFTFVKNNNSHFIRSYIENPHSLRFFLVHNEFAPWNIFSKRVITECKFDATFSRENYRILIFHLLGNANNFIGKFSWIYPRYFPQMKKNCSRLY